MFIVSSTNVSFVHLLCNGGGARRACKMWSDMCVNGSGGIYKVVGGGQYYL